jgi:hypothetical protein
MMRLLFAASAMIFVAGQALADNADFTLVNSTGYPISEFYVSPPSADSWGADILGKHTIAHGDGWRITFPKAGDNCVQDLRIVFEDDNSKVTWPGVDLCSLDKLTLTYNRGTGVTSAHKE